MSIESAGRDNDGQTASCNSSLNEAFEINCVLTRLFTKSSIREAVQCNEHNCLI